MTANARRGAFELDAFQTEAIAHLDAGRSVVVAAPTGAGKTVVAEHAIDLALRDGTKVFYTTPIKALSNQKYNDFVALHGAESVGLLTGDTSINGDASVVVMTTEVLRNMLYSASSSLGSLGFVILDEVHYLQDPYRGPVWEEVVIHTPAAVRFVCLSATVSNADELTSWIDTVRGDTGLVVHHERPVELTNLYLVHERDARREHLIPTLVNGEPNQAGHRFTAANSLGPKGSRGRQHGSKKRGRRPYAIPRRREVLDQLEQQDLLPAIVFVFSRAGCEEAARDLVDGGVWLTEATERDEIRATAEHHVRHLAASDLDVLRFDRFLRGLERGIAAHHAGMVPAFKEAVEACFVRGLVKLVFATETLALGINMPARAVVIEHLTKFNGDSHQFLTPLEYTQLTGRAGRRGIDDHGFALVLWSPFVTFEQVADLAASRSFSLRSSFRPTYNMAVNLVRLHDRNGAHHLLDQSFGQFQADRDLSVMSQRKRELELGVQEIEERLLAAGEDPDQPPAAVASEEPVAWAPLVVGALAKLRPGDIVATPNQVKSEPAVVLSVGYRSGGVIKVHLTTVSHHRLTLTAEDFRRPPAVLGSVVLPEPYRPNSHSFQHEVIRKLRRARLSKRRQGPDIEPSAPETKVPNPGKDQRRLAEKRRQVRRLEQRMKGRSSRLSRQFDDIVGLLQLRGYVANWDTTAYGDILRGLFHENDLAMAEAIRLGVFDELSVAELAGLASCFTYEHRGPGPAPSPRLRSALLRDRFRALDHIVAELQEDESQAGIRLTQNIDAGFVTVAAAWAGGEDLISVLDQDELTGGDFVRQIRQLVDVLRQIGAVAPLTATRHCAHSAADALHRGVVVASTTVGDEKQ